MKNGWKTGDVVVGWVVGGLLGAALTLIGSCTASSFDEYVRRAAKEAAIGANMRCSQIVGNGFTMEVPCR